MDMLAAYSALHTHFLTIFQIFQVSVYVEAGHRADGDPNYRSDHNRLAFHSGLMSVRNIIEHQVYPEGRGVQEALPIESLKYRRGRVLVAGEWYQPDL